MAKGRRLCQCTSTTAILIFVVVLVIGAAVWFAPKMFESTKVYVVQTPAPVQPTVQPTIQSTIRPDLYPEPVQRLNIGFGVHTRGALGPIQQVGLLTGEGGSSSSAAPDRTILPLYGRELDARRGRWNYYTRTDGTNPVQVPVRVKNRVCDDDTNGCDEVYSDDSVHVPVLGRSFKATVYRKSIF